MKQKRLLLLLALLMTAATGAWAQEPETTTYSVKMKAGTEDAANWTIASGENSVTGDAADGLTGLSEGDAVTLQYNGRLKVKGVKATSDAQPAVWDGDLSKLTAESTAEFATATDGMTIKGALAEGVNVKVCIAEGATVTLDGVTINGVHNNSYQWAGINCLGDATIILSGTNTVKGFHGNYPGIHVPVDKTVTIQGSGSLTASSNGAGCGIGGGWEIACGNIVIAGGTITANGGSDAAGIGSGLMGSCGNISITDGTITATAGTGGAGIGSGTEGSCGNISITGGTVTATGGKRAAGIGSGNEGSCGTVTITNGVTSVTATMGNMAYYSIGAGKNGSCGTVTIGGTVYWQNNAAVGDGATYLAQATIEYPAPAATVTTAPTATTGDIAAGSETALVSGGAATGGTMMYKVTTENTKPTSTEGFSADVPTAETLAAGTYYVWYYVEGDASHTDSEISATGIEVTIAAAPPTLADAFTNDAEVTVKVKTANNQWLGATGTYTSGTYDTSGIGSVLSPSSVSMTKDGSNLVVTVTSSFNTYTVTFYSTNNTYKEDAASSTSAWRMTELQSITINGVDITSTLTVTPSETISLVNLGSLSPIEGTNFDVTGNGNSTDTGKQVNQWNNLTITAKNSKTIKEVVLSYGSNSQYAGTLSASPGSYDGTNTITGINASSLTISSSHTSGVWISSVKIYY